MFYYEDWIKYAQLIIINKQVIFYWLKFEQRIANNRCFY